MTIRPYTLDERLAGHTWDHFSPYNDKFEMRPITELGYYTFSEADDETGDYFLTVHDTPGNFPLRKYVSYSVYSKDGVIYDKGTKSKIMEYEFLEKWPFRSDYSPLRYYMDESIERGHLTIITYRLYNGASYWDDERADYKWLLILREES